MRHLCVLAGLAITSSALATPPQRTIVTLDQTVSAIDERPIRYYIDRPSIDERVPLLVVVDGSGCVGQKRPSSWGSYAPKPDDAIPFARVMVEKPRLLIADELSLGLAPIVVDEVYDTLATIRGTGTALLIVEQHVQHALDVCDRVALLDHGTIAWEGPAADAAEVVVTHLFDREGS